MKFTSNVLALVLCVTVFCSLSSQAEETLYYMRIENQRVVDDVLEFDVTIENTGETDIWVGESDLVLEFNTAAFNPGILDVESSTLSQEYALDVVETPEGGYLVSIVSPLFSGEAQFKERITLIEANSDKIVLLTGRLTAVSDTSAWSGLNWDMTSTFPQSMYTYNPENYQQTDISEFAFFRPAQDFYLGTIVSVHDQTSEPILTVFPNPVSEYLVVEGGQAPLSVSLANYRGEETPLRFISQRKINITPDIAVGPYLLRVTYPDRVVAFRIQIQR